MVAFYNQADQDIYKTSQYMPQSRFLLNAPKPVVEEEKITESFGIPQTQAFTNSGDNNFSGSTSNLGGNFQRAVDARQARLNDTSLNKNFLGFPSYRQGVTGADAGEYVGNNMDIPTQETFMGKAQNFLEPQSASQIMTDGYQEPRFQPGIMATIMSKMDNYRNLPRADQAFIAQNMGYTGPTVFGENNSGLGKDPFGINTRSAFGNYGEYVGNAVTDLEEALENAKNKDMYNKGGKFNKALFDKNTKLLRTKLDFYRNKKQEREQIQGDVLAGQMERDRDAGAAGKSDSQDQSRTGSSGRRPGSGGTVDRVTEGQGQNVSNVDNQAYDSGGREGFGYGLKDGGRAGYFFGGRVSFKNGGLASIL